MADTRAEKIMRQLVKAVDAFDDECEENSHTDTGEAWDLFNMIRDSLRVAITESKNERACKFENTPGVFRVCRKCDKPRDQHRGY